MKSVEEWFRLAAQYYTSEAVRPFDRSRPGYRAELESYMEEFEAPARSDEEQRQKFDGLAEGYLQYGFDPIFGPVFCKTISLVAAYLEKNSPARALDCGCGMGLEVEFLAKSFPKTQFLGSDVSPKMIAIAGERARKASLSINYYPMAHGELTPEAIGGEVDVCFALGSVFFSGLAQLTQHLYGFSKVLREGGGLLVVVPLECVEGLEAAGRITGFPATVETWSISGDTMAPFAMVLLKKEVTPSRELLNLRVALTYQREY